MISLEIGSHAVCTKELNGTYNKCLSTLGTATFQHKSYGNSGMRNASPSSPPRLVRDYTVALKSTHSLVPDAPVRLKKELNNIIAIQSDLDTVDTAISKARTSFKEAGQGTQQACKALDSLCRTQQRLKGKVESLYSTLNVPDMMPEFRNVDIQFVHTLFLARDLKMNIRKRAIGSFLEWERLDQAVGGKGQPLGNVVLLCECMVHLEYLRHETSPADAESNHQAETSITECCTQVQYILRDTQRVAPASEYYCYSSAAPYRPRQTSW